VSSLLRVRPTKIELIKLRRRLVLARKVHRILRERLTILVNEFLIRVREAYALRIDASKDLDRVYRQAVYMYGFYGDMLQEHLRRTIKKDAKVITGVENIMGVKTPALHLIEPEYTVNPLLPDVTEFRETAIRAVKKILELGQAERAVISLGKEIKKTRRKVNALEYILIPKILATIKYLRMKFEEREREEKARLKRVKSILERRRAL